MGTLQATALAPPRSLLTTDETGGSLVWVCRVGDRGVQGGGGTPAGAAVGEVGAGRF